MGNKKPFKIRDKVTKEELDIYYPGEDINVGDAENFVSLPDKLAEIESDVEAAGQVNDIKVGNDTYTPTNKTIDLSAPFAAKQDAINDLSDIRAGASAGDTALQPGDDVPATDVTGLAQVATSGSYNDLSNKPTIPTKTSDLSNDSGFVTDAVQSVTVNGDTVTPDAQGNVDLGTIQGQKGDKGDKGDTVVLDPSQVEQFDIINGLNAQSAGNALDAYQGAQLKAKINEVYTRLKAVYATLGNIAFWDGKPAASTILPDLDWGLPKHTVTLDLDLTNVVVKHNGVAVADGDTIQVEEYETLTLTVEAESGYALNSVLSQVGTVSQDLTTVTLVMGQSDVTLDITATAVATYSIAIGTLTNCSVVGTAPTSIVGGDSVGIQFAADSGYQLDASCFTVTNASKAWDSSTNTLTISNPTGNVTISATAVVPKLKFLKGYRLTGYDTITNGEWSVGGTDKSALCTVSQMMKLPVQEVSSIPTMNIYWGVNVASGESQPFAIALYEINNGNFDPIGYYQFKIGAKYKADLSLSYASGKSSADVVSALNAGNLGVRVTICTNSAGTALTKSTSYGVQIGSFVFQPDSPAGNYEFTTDATDFLDQVFEF